MLYLTYTDTFFLWFNWTLEFQPGRRSPGCLYYIHIMITLKGNVLGKPFLFPSQLLLREDTATCLV